MHTIDNKNAAEVNKNQPDTKVANESVSKTKEVPRTWEVDNEDDGYDLYEVSSHEDSVVVDQRYQEQVARDKNAPEKVIVDPEYVVNPQHHKDKVIVDAAYNEAIRDESPEDYIPELPSELLQEIEDQPENEGARENALVYEQELQRIANLRRAELAPLEARRQELKTAIASKKRKASTERRQLLELDREIAWIDLKHRRSEDLAARTLEVKTLQKGEVYEVDPEKYAAAVKRYEAACASIEDDYEGDMAEARSEYEQLYDEYTKTKFAGDYSRRHLMGKAKNLFEVALPSLREKRLKEAYQVFQEEVTPTAYEHMLFETTLAFEKRATKVQGIIDGLQFDMERISKADFPEAWHNSQQHINALKREGQHLAAQYSRDVESLKASEYARRKKQVFDDALTGRTEKQKVVKETLPPERVALDFAHEIHELVEELGSIYQKGKEGEYIEGSMEMIVEMEVLDSEQDTRTESARVGIETTVLGDEEGALDDEERAVIAEEYKKRCQHIADDFKQKVSEAMNEFLPLYQRLIKEFPAESTKKTDEDEENEEEKIPMSDVELGLRKKLAFLRYEIDVKLESDRKADMYTARKAYERSMTPTAHEKELFAATVRFERQALRIEEQKKNIHDMMVMVTEFPDAVDVYRKELRKMDDNMKTLAKKYGDEVNMLKKEQLLIASYRTADRTEGQSVENSTAQTNFEKAA